MNLDFCSDRFIPQSRWHHGHFWKAQGLAFQSFDSDRGVWKLILDQSILVKCFGKVAPGVVNLAHDKQGLIAVRALTLHPAWLFISGIGNFPGNADRLIKLAQLIEGQSLAELETIEKTALGIEFHSLFRHPHHSLIGLQTCKVSNQSQIRFISQRIVWREGQKQLGQCNRLSQKLGMSHLCAHQFPASLRICL